MPYVYILSVTSDNDNNYRWELGDYDDFGPKWIENVYESYVSAVNDVPEFNKKIKEEYGITNEYELVEGIEIKESEVENEVNDDSVQLLYKKDITINSKFGYEINIHKYKVSH